MLRKETGKNDSEIPAGKELICSHLRGISILTSQVLRSCLKYSPHKIIGPTILFIIVLISIASLFQPSLTLLIISSAASVLFGIFLIALAFITTLIRQLTLLDQQSQEEVNLHQEPELRTGLKALDDLLLEHHNHILELHEKIKASTAENNMLLHRYEVLTESLVAAIIIRDKNSKIAYCSPYTEVLTGYSLFDIYAMEEDFFYSIIHEEDREKYCRSLKVSNYGEAFQFRYRFFHKTGIEMWAETRTVPIIDENGEITSSLSITLDVTATVRHQKQVEEKNRDLEDFSYMISHDLKAPIYTIKGMVNLIEEDYQDQLPEELSEPIEHICQATHRLEKLVASVLEYSRISTQENQIEIVDLNLVINEVKQDFAAQISEANGKLVVQDNLPAIIGDKLKVYQILSNITGNAIKYRSDQRPLEIAISEHESQRKRYLTLSIKDNGTGIPENKLDEIFRPFQRAHSQEIEGSGIGLACVKKLLEKLSGDIEVKSKYGLGSEFLVLFKRASNSDHRETAIS
jgi:PAS domain S-box-containing protein